MMDAQYDIAIVGGGLAGVSLAQALRDYHGKVALIDQHDISHPEAFHPPLRAIALSDGSHRILSSLGVWDAIDQHACVVKQIRVSEKNTFGITDINAQHEGLDAVGYVVTNTLLLKSLYAANSLSSKVTFFPLSTVTDVQRNDESIHLSVRSSNGVQALSARLLVLSDGGVSPLTSTLGFKQHEVDYQQTALVAVVRTRNQYDGIVYERFAAGNLLAVLPLDNAAERAVVWVMRNEVLSNVESLSDEALVGAMQEQLGVYLDIDSIVGERFTYPLVRRQVIEPAGGRVVLLGDAAHRIHPVAGQGFNLSLRDMAFLAEVISASEDAGAADVLAQYVRSRKADVRRVVCFTDTLARIIMQPSRSVAIMRGVGLTAFNMLPPIRRMMVRHNLGLSPPYSRLASGMPLSR